jgi:hypothetical protein
MAVVRRDLELINRPVDRHASLPERRLIRKLSELPDPPVLAILPNNRLGMMVPQERAVQFAVEVQVIRGDPRLVPSRLVLLSLLDGAHPAECTGGEEEHRKDTGCCPSALRTAFAPVMPPG